MVAEQSDDLFGLVHPHQSVVDEDAGQLVADRFVDQNGGDGGIDTARQAANDLSIAHLLADFRDLGGAEFGHGPIAGEAADMAREIGDQLRPIGRVDDFGMELDAVILARLVRDHGEGRAIAGGDDLEPVGKARDLVAMAHPNLMALALLP